MISPRAAATTWPPTTSRRCSWPRMKRSTITSLPSGSATAKAASTSSRVCSSSETPRPWLASEGLTTTGRPMSSAASQASSALATTWPSGTGTPQPASSVLVEFLVAGDGLADGAGVVGLGGPDALLVGAVAELHQVAAVQAHVRNAAVGGGADDAGGARAEVAVLDLGLDRVDRALHVGGVEGVVVDGRHQQAVALGQRDAGDLLVARAEHHAVDAVLRGAAGLAEAGGHAGQVEQLDHHVLQHVAGPGAFVQALDEAAALADAAVVLDQRRQQRRSGGR